MVQADACDVADYGAVGNTGVESEDGLEVASQQNSLIEGCLGRSDEHTGAQLLDLLHVVCCLCKQKPSHVFIGCLLGK